MAGSRRAKALLDFLAAEGRRLSPLLILTHDHPDPDALASAWGLAHLARSLGGIKARIGYGGAIGRAENRMMAERLGIPAERLGPREIASFDHAALVDTQPAFRNNRFPPRRKPDIIIDHHPLNAATRARFAWIDKTAGATTTLIAEAFLASGVRVPPRLSTAIVYGIGSETQNLGREATGRDLAVYQAFWPKASVKTLWNIAYPRHSSDFFATIARAIRRCFTARNVIGTNLGPLKSPDRVAQVADFLLTHESMRWSIVTGRCRGKLHVSLRTTDPEGGAGRLLRRLLGGQNRAGGHEMIAGGALEVGADASEEKWAEVEDAVMLAFLESRGIKRPDDRARPYESV